MDRISRSNPGKFTVSHDDNIIKRHPDTENIIYPISQSRYHNLQGKASQLFLPGMTVCSQRKKQTGNSSAALMQ
jgi:hypothetical protein